ncbi:MAG TPA: hypothetical protein VMU55_04815 [Solirubrobacteraceae bacterium]|nr:hypothetical protein [Solirubrobacteraceae bacterium]
MFLLAGDTRSPDQPTIAPRPDLAPGPDLGVIEEARRRQRARRTRIMIAAICAGVVLGVLFLALDGGRWGAALGHAGQAGGAHTANASNSHLAFNVRLVPTLTVGQAGWCEVIEENGRTGGSACGGVPTPSQALLQVQGSYAAGSAYETTVVVSDPQVAAILANGKLRTPTVSLPGLPYGLRGALIRVPVKEQTAPGGRLRRYAADPILQALDAQGHPIPQRWQNRVALQATVHSWRYPSPPANGSCRLHATLPGLTARRGQVASDIRPFPGTLLGRAFLPCIATVYNLHGLPLTATAVLDAANPGTLPAALPDFKPVPRAPGLFAQGSLTARRFGNGWLIASQGTGLAQRIRLLHHLTLTVKA